MTDDLISRMHAGDTAASAVVRAAVRGVAERVLNHPSLRGRLGPRAKVRFGDVEQRRLVLAKIVREVCERGGKKLSEYKALSFMVAGRVVAEGLQEGRRGVGHLEPSVIVSFANAPASLTDAVRETVRNHIEICDTCARDTDVLRNIGRSQITADRQGRPGDLPHHADLLGHADTTDPRRQDLNRPLPTKRVLPFPESDDTGTDNLPMWSRIVRVLLPIVALAIVLGFVWFASQTSVEVGFTKKNHLALLADTSPPVIGRLRSFPPQAHLALGDLGAGRCESAAERFRSVQDGNPDDARLVLLEGASYVCADDGGRAVAILGGLLKGTDSPPPQTYWYLAQAYLIEGERVDAMFALSKAVLHDPRHRKAAQKQIKTIEKMVK